MENSKQPKKKKVSEEDLGTISGGCGYDPHTDFNLMTLMVCGKCNYKAMWEGNYVDHVVYMCPRCNNMRFHGIECKSIGEWKINPPH